MRPGLEGWGIQQDNPNGLETYYYDARTGQILRSYSNPKDPAATWGAERSPTSIRNAQATSIGASMTS